MSGEGRERVRFLLVGGFLGAGKTTALGRLARYLGERGLRVGLITNDQSRSLVDTALLRAQGHRVEEIAGGCLCCRFDDLRAAMERLEESGRVDVLVAEPVGSCTDLVATVGYPLRRLLGDDLALAPLSVLVDPLRAARILGLRPGRSFSPQVAYIYRKQLEEADLIIINKCDLIEAELRAELSAALGEAFPGARVLRCSAREGQGLEPWFDLLVREERGRTPTMALDYEEYAAGEALLGWLNATLELGAAAPVDGEKLLGELARKLCAGIAGAALEIAHLKLTLESGGAIAALSIVDAGEEPLQRGAPLGAVRRARLIVNLRAEGDPVRLEEILRAAVADLDGARLSIEHLEAFRPARPEPTHRLRTPNEVLP